MSDQAERLRQMARRLQSAFPAGPAEGAAELPGVPIQVSPVTRPDPAVSVAQRRARVIAVTSGKGGVGKTNVSVNLAYALQHLGRAVVVLDADLSLANVDVLLGTTPRYHLGHLLTGERTIGELLYTAPEGLRLIAGGSGLTELIHVSPEGLARFIRSMHDLQHVADYVLVDTSAGLGPAVLAFTLAADDVLLVTTPEPTAMTDAYALVKTLVRRQPGVRISLVVNMAEDHREAQEAADRLCTTTLRFLNTPLEVLGFLPFDPQVARSVRRQAPFVLAQPDSPAARGVVQLARRLSGAPAQTPSLFMDRLTRLMARWHLRTER